MSLFKNRGQNLSRATSIIQEMNKGQEGKETPVVEVPVVEPVVIEQPIVETTVVETPVVEVPPQENIQPEVIPVVDSAPPTVEPTVVEPVVEVQQDLPVSEEIVLSRISEMLGREVKSLDDLKPKERNSQIKEIEDWAEKTGLSISEWSNYTKDFSQMGDLDVAREILSQKYSDLTKEELDYSLKDYIYDGDIDEEGDRIKKSIALKKLAQDGRTTLEANRLTLTESASKTSLTQEQKESIDFATQTRASQTEVQNAQLDYTNAINSSATSFNTLELKLSDDLTVQHKITEESQKGLPKYISEMAHWRKEDGSYNHNSIVSDGYKIKNFDSLIKAAFEQGKSVGVEGNIKGNKNITLGEQVLPQGGEEAPKGNINDVVAKLGGNRGSNFRFRGKKQ